MSIRLKYLPSLRNKYTPILLLALLFTSVTLSLVQPLSVSAAGCPDTPYLAVTTNIQASGDYAVWVEERLPADSSATVSVSADNGATCSKLEQPGSKDTWAWVSGGNSPLKLGLTDKTTALRLYTEGGKTQLAKLLLTLDIACIPTDDGSNCVQQPIDFSITGIAQNQVISASPIVETIIAEDVTQTVQIEYFLDNATSSFSTSTSAPYCLVLTNAACTGWPSSSLADGEHTLTVRSTSESGRVEKTIKFTVDNVVDVPAKEESPNDTTTTPVSTPTTPPVAVTPQANPAPSPTPAPVQATPTTPAVTPTTPTAPSSPPPVVALPPTPSPSPSPSPSYSPSTPTYSPVSPSQAVAPTAPTVTPTTPVTSSLPSTYESQTNTLTDTSGNTNSTATVKSAFVAGLDLNGEISGEAIVSLPKSVVAVLGDKVELLANGVVIESKEITNPSIPASFVLDTTKLKNGTSVISLRTTNVTGEVATYSSTVKIANNSLAASAGSVKSKWPLYLLSAIVMLGIGVGAWFALRYYKNMREFSNAHNTDDYTYVQPENPYANVAGASVAILLGISAVIFMNASQSYAANLGYIYELKSATLAKEFTVGQDTAANKSYVLLTSEKAVDPTPPTATPPAVTPSPINPADGKYDVFTFGDSVTVEMVYNGLLQAYNDVGLSANTGFNKSGYEQVGASIRARGGWQLAHIEQLLESHRQDLAKADIIVMAIGSNDSPATEPYVDKIDKFLDKLHGYNPKAKILWVNVFFVNDGKNYAVKNGQLLQYYTNPLIARGVEKGRAKGIDVQVIDFEGAIKRGEVIAPDRDHVHFTGAGAAKQAKWLAGQVKKAAGL